MKKALIFVLVGGVVVAAVCAYQSHQSAVHQREVAALNLQLEEKAHEAEQLRIAEKRAEDRAKDLRQQRDDLSHQIAAQHEPEAQVKTGNSAQPVQPATPPTEGVKPEQQKNGFAGMLSKMMQDPETRKFIRDQQRMTMDQVYGPLAKQLSLTPEEADKLKDMLADNMMKGAEKASSLAGAANQKEALDGLKTSQQNFDEEVKALLGESRYAVYKEYQETVGERMQLNQFKLAAGETALNEQQTEQLLSIMKEEKKSVSAAMSGAFPGPGPDQAQKLAARTDEQIEKLLSAQGSMNEHVYQRAGEVLSPDQIAAFGKFQTNQLQMMKVGMTMARKFMGGDKE